MTHLDTFRELCIRCVYSMVENETISHKPFFDNVSKIDKAYKRFELYIEICPTDKEKNQLSELYAIKLKSLYESAAKESK